MCLLGADAKNVYDPFLGLCEELCPPSVNTSAAFADEGSPCARHYARCFILYFWPQQPSGRHSSSARLTDGKTEAQVTQLASGGVGF